VVRVGRAEVIAPELLGRMPDALGGLAAIGEADVLLATCVGAGADSVRRHGGTFPAVLIDETAQSTEPSTLVPLTLGCRQLVLVGDHKQLRPTVLSELAAERGLQARDRGSLMISASFDLSGAGTCLIWQVSLFERLIRAGVEPHLLDTQVAIHSLNLP
jgi:superfamily I DNA and/or RNA helicase